MEQYKTEADKVVSNIVAKTKESLGSMVFSEFGYNHLGFTLAIQDRQSVLEALEYSYKLTNPSESVWHHLKREIQSLTQQIDYLKNKL